MGRVQVLPDLLVNQIAAGEVIERPASVVKELVENALDASALRVGIEVDAGGVARISITDDGIGMGPEDARMAFERHATSKIRSLEDLSRIGTLGFRGEAIPSIASVSRMTLTTSPDDSGLGTEVLVDRGGAPAVSPSRHPRGTRVAVEDLFGNVPARRKFLKSPEAELKAIVRTVTSLALSQPQVAFTLAAGERPLLDLAVAPSAGARFEEVLGKRAAGDVLPVAYEGWGMTLRGVVTRPAVSFASRSYQWLFVNGRGAKDGSVSHAAALAAREALLGDRHPGFVLFLTCDPAACDVNVHPQKLEVRFRDASVVHSLVHRALVAALTKGKTAVALTGDSLVSSSWPFESRTPFPAPSRAASVLAEAIGVFSPREDRGSLVEAPAVGVSGSAYAPLSTDSPLGTLRLLGQYRDSFLIAESGSGLVLVDQHVAHERVRFERIRARLSSKAIASQQLLIPVPFDASIAEAEELRQREGDLSSAGFLVSELSGRTFLVTAAPADCAAAAVEPFLRDFLSRKEAGADRLTALAASLACRGAITVNTPLRAEEAARLLADLSTCEDPYTCPHGRPILLTFEHGELLKRFGRPR